MMLKRISNNLTVFLLEGNKSVDRSNKFVLLLLYKFKYLVFNFAGLIVFVEHNILATLLQQHDHFVVIKGEDNISYFNFGDIDSLPLRLEIFNFILGLCLSFGLLVFFL